MDGSTPTNANPKFDSMMPTSSISGAFTIGSVLKDCYRIEREIGKGGFGIVYEATDLRSETRVAIKTLKHNLDDYDIASKRFKREIKLCQSIENPHAVKIFDDGMSDNGTLYYVMEYLEGCGLDALIEKREKFTFRETKAILIQVLEALAEAHAKGIIHRDLKPANIWLTEKSTPSQTRDYDVKVLDFGIAKAIDANANEDKLTQTGTWMGTPAYMSPEVLTGRDITASSDIFAIGLIAIEMITNRPPVEGDTPMEIAMEILSKNDIYIEDWILDTSFGACLAKSVKKSPSERYKNAQEIYEELAVMDDDELRNEFNEAKLRRKTRSRSAVIPPNDDKTHDKSKVNFIIFGLIGFCIILILILILFTLKLENNQQTQEDITAKTSAANTVPSNHSNTDVHIKDPTNTSDHLQLEENTAQNTESETTNLENADENTAQNTESETTNLENADENTAQNTESETTNLENADETDVLKAQDETQDLERADAPPPQNKDQKAKDSERAATQKTKKEAKKRAAETAANEAQKQQEIEQAAIQAEANSMLKQHRINQLTSELKKVSLASSKCLSTCLRHKTLDEIMTLKDEKPMKVPEIYLQSNGKVVSSDVPRDRLEASPNVKLCKEICSKG